tara:strand:- start:87 stop:710 length:624 start_codon:yes stop_codon:yes gene_type:complete
MCLSFRILLLFSLILLLSTNEGYKNNTQIYQANMPPKDRPHEMQFKPCHDYSKGSHRGIPVELKGTNNYKLERHHIRNPGTGVYSSFLNKYGIRNFDEFFHAPICEEEYTFQDINSLGDRIIPLDDATQARLGMSETTDDIIENEILLDSKGVRNPDYKYVRAGYIGNKLTYPDKLTKLMVESHDSHNTENLQHRLDDRLYGNDIQL